MGLVVQDEDGEAGAGTRDKDHKVWGEERRAVEGLEKVCQIPQARQLEQEDEKGLSSNPNLVLWVMLFDTALESYPVYVGHFLPVSWISTGWLTLRGRKIAQPARDIEPWCFDFKFILYSVPEMGSLCLQGDP